MYFMFLFKFSLTFCYFLFQSYRMVGKRVVGKPLYSFSKKVVFPKEKYDFTFSLNFKVAGPI